MRTSLRFKNHGADRPASRALTILEMLVSVALLSVIILGLTAMFVQTTKAFKSGIKQTSVTDAGRATIDLIAADISQLSNPGFTNVQNNFYLPYPAGPWPTNLFCQTSAISNLIQTLNNGAAGNTYRTNELQVIFGLYQTNATWVGFGYFVSNWFPEMPGCGTLYRYYATTYAPLPETNQLMYNYFNYLTNLHRVADGVVHLQMYLYDTNGNLNTSLSYPNVTQVPFVSPAVYQTNYLPGSADIELGVLEPEAIEHVKALYSAGAINAASGYLMTNCGGQVQIFRQHILIPAAQ